MSDDGGSPYGGIRESLDQADRMSADCAVVTPIIHVGFEERSLRDYFAAKAMQGYLAQLVDHAISITLVEMAKEEGKTLQEAIADIAYQYADAMMKERK